MDISEDVLMAARELARRDKKTAGQVISELARRGLQRPGPLQNGNDRPDAFFGFHPLPHRGVVVTNELINRLKEEDID